MVFKLAKYFYCRQREIKKVFHDSFLIILFIFIFCYYTFFALLKNPAHPVHRVIVLLAKYFGENLTGRSNQINKFVFFFFFLSLFFHGVLFARDYSLTFYTPSLSFFFFSSFFFSLLRIDVISHVSGKPTVSACLYRSS